MIKFEIVEIKTDPPSTQLKDEWDFLINIYGRLKVFIDGELFFDDSGTTIVELAVELKKWLCIPEETSFQFLTIDDEEEDSFNIVFTDTKKYRFESAWQKFESHTTFSREEVDLFALSYIRSVILLVNQELTVNLNEKIGL